LEANRLSKLPGYAECFLLVAFHRRLFDGRFVQGLAFGRVDAATTLGNAGKKATCTHRFGNEAIVHGEGCGRFDAAKLASNTATLVGRFETEAQALFRKKKRNKRRSGERHSKTIKMQNEYSDSMVEETTNSIEREKEQLTFDGIGNFHLQAASDFAAFFVFFVRNHTAAQMFLAVEGAARILDAAKAFFGMGASNDAVLAVK